MRMDRPMFCPLKDGEMTHRFVVAQVGRRKLPSHRFHTGGYCGLSRTARPFNCSGRLRLALIASGACDALLHFFLLDSSHWSPCSQAAATQQQTRAPMRRDVAVSARAACR
jgi:hypothetical protein